MVAIYNGILLNHKNEWNNAIWSNMDGPRDYHIKWSKSEKDKYHIISFISGIEKKIQVTLYIKQKQTHRHWNQSHGYQRRREKGKIRSLGFIDTHYYI